MITELPLGRAWMRIPAADPKSSSFQDSSSGSLNPEQLLPWLLSAKVGDWDIKRGGSLAGYFQILWRAEEETWNLDSRDSVLQRQWVPGKLTTKHRLLGA